MKEPKIELTNDGSHTLVHPKYEAHYHSKAGAIQESDFIYINEGLNHILNDQNLDVVSVLEMGFGTGLNAFNTFLEATKKGLKINYVAIEKYPLVKETLKELNYVSLLKAEEFEDVFFKIHEVEADLDHEISSNFKLYKKHIDFFDTDFDNQFNVVYFDAFSPYEQPELWTEKLFQLMYNALKSNGILITYCSQGKAKRALREVGFTVKRLPGPPSKRHILRATKLL